MIVKDDRTGNNNLITPPMIIKRHAVEARYEPLMPNWYGQAGAVIREQNRLF